ncbi:SDR family oxidoreductase [Leptospira sp. 201903071]|uniref:NAD-dependent epimerase/dehydratase family protein n=1 Tax=Leptospira ainazelensis TaxID=2810034 RepID=UPI0019624582|nr:SDR family oxidoreductase [Leptospira ainazelensis]MBM9501973.1 SDR family oxidoreductase [Leptospira ainazelensis]
MNILITGAFGYLGGRLVEYFNKRLPQVRLRLGTTKNQNPHKVKENEIFQCDWSVEKNLEEACDGIDVIIHTAGMNAQDCSSDPAGAFEVNTVNTGKLLKAATQKKVRKFIYISTAHIYSNNLVNRILESTPATNTHPYASSHKAGEDLAMHYDSLNKLESVVFRLSNSYGPPVDEKANCWSLLIPDLCKQAVLDNKIVLRTTGLQRRNFISLTDACGAVEFICKSMSNIRGVFNLGGIWNPTVWEVAVLVQDRCEALLGKRPELQRVEPGPSEETMSLIYDISKLSDLGFSPTTNNVIEIDNLIRFCKEKFHQP